MKKTAIITGASGGIGSAIAGRLADAGYILALFGNTAGEALEHTADICRKKGASTYTYLANLGSFEDAARHIEDAATTLRQVDLLINCAGISYVGLLTDMTNENWMHLMQSNLSSMFYTCRTIIPHMVHEKKGRILNISSIWGNVGASCEAAYSATKGGVNSLTKALAKELAPSGIAVNALACGMIDTVMNHCFDEGEIRAICEEIPAGRMGTPDEVAEMAYLLTQAPYYLTGQIITMDGGWC